MPTIYDVYTAIGRRFRTRRMLAFAERFQPTAETRILDIGGYYDMWRHLPVRPKLTLLNLNPHSGELPEWVTFIQGDARDMPFDDQSFDIVYSNSVIEHVGTFDDQRRFANEVRRVGRSYYVQTPNRHFPIEPHFLGVGIQFMPRALARRAARYASLWGLMQRPSWTEVDALVDEVRLLSASEMRWLFSGADLVRERVGPLTKSLMAVQHS